MLRYSNITIFLLTYRAKFICFGLEQITGRYRQRLHSAPTIGYERQVLFIAAKRERERGRVHEESEVKRKRNAERRKSYFPEEQDTASPKFKFRANKRFYWQIYILALNIIYFSSFYVASPLRDTLCVKMAIVAQVERVIRAILSPLIVLFLSLQIKLLVQQKAQLARPVLEASLEKMRVSLYKTKLLTTMAYLPAFCFVSFLQFGSMLG